ncbi:hypothetical protein LIER_24318 [Lithospermum erythrorhizon]|uniref:Uncharacterized protein n=1 Tax=Lithospermum erythrorhizon TaxID=34254 RepID=A0AAV3R0L2_LITER
MGCPGNGNGIACVLMLIWKLRNRVEFEEEGVALEQVWLAGFELAESYKRACSTINSQGESSTADSETSNANNQGWIKPQQRWTKLNNDAT